MGLLIGLAALPLVLAAPPAWLEDHPGSQPLRVCGQTEPARWLTSTRIGSGPWSESESLEGYPLHFLTASPPGPAELESLYLEAARRLGFRPRGDALKTSRRLRSPAEGLTLGFDDRGRLQITEGEGPRAGLALWLEQGRLTSEREPLSPPEWTSLSVAPGPSDPEGGSLESLMSSILGASQTAHWSQITLGGLCDTLSSTHEAALFFVGEAAAPLTLMSLGSPLEAKLESLADPESQAVLREPLASGAELWSPHPGLAGEGWIWIPAGEAMLGMEPPMLRERTDALSRLGLRVLPAGEAGVWLQQTSSGSAAPSPSEAERAQRRADRERRMMERERSPEEAGFRLEEGRHHIPRESLRQLLSEPLDHLVRRRAPGGAIRGLELRTARDWPYRGSALGLESGDLLTGWSGGPLHSAEELQALLRALAASSDPLELSLIRGGEALRLSWVLEGPPLELEPPLPPLEADLDEDRMVRGVQTLPEGAQLDRSLLSEALEGEWGGVFILREDQLVWRGESSPPWGLQWALGRQRAMVGLQDAPELELEELLPQLLSRLAEADQLTLIDPEGGSHSLHLQGPPIRLHAGPQPPLLRPGWITLSQRCDWLDLAMRSGRFVPHRDESDRMDAFSVYGVHSDSLFGLIGLRNGDLLLGLDGDPPDWMGVTQGDVMEQWIRWMETMQEPGEHQVSLLRRGRERTVSFQTEAGSCPL